MGRRYRWVFGVFVVVLVALVGVYAYNAGVAQGLLESGKLGTASGAAPPVMGWYPHPWGFGFFPFFPFLFILFSVFLFRGLFWRRRYWHRGFRPHYGIDGVPPAFEEWHRRAHARQEGGSDEHRPA
jgi:hypothetical protein